ncbi:hypothetical protein SP41_124 [Salmonella phage 41]|nr:hypothetical protein SP41_124 [Salmonella phage 41]
MRYPSTQTTAGYLYPYGPGRWTSLMVAVLDDSWLEFTDYRRT